MLDARTFIRSVLERPSWLLLPVLESGALDVLEDERYLALSHRLMMGGRFDMEHPRSFNEKIAWIKLNDRKPVYREMADKLLARSFVERCVGNEWLVPLLGIWDDPDRVDFDSLPQRFVLKCTHGHGGVVACPDKSRFDKGSALDALRIAHKRDHFSAAREWVYRHPRPRIIAERYIDDGGGAYPADYKFLCMNGRVKLVCLSRGLGDFKTGSVSFFLPDGERAPFKRLDYPDFPDDLAIDAPYLSMLEAAERLARFSGALFLRVDFLRTQQRPYFSEFTFYPCGGSMFLDPPEYDDVVGSLLELSESGR